MLLERLDDRVDHVAVRTIPAFYVNMGRRVRWCPLFGQAFERALRIAVAEQRPGVPARSPFGENVDGSIEPDRDRARIEKVAGSRIDEHPAAGGDDPDLAVDQAGDEAPLAVAEIFLSKSFEDLGRRKPGRILDRCVAIDKGQPESLREPAPDGRFADSHQPDKDDGTVEMLGQFMHAVGYTALDKPGKSPRLNSNQAEPRCRD